MILSAKSSRSPGRGLLVLLLALATVIAAAFWLLRRRGTETAGPTPEPPGVAAGSQPEAELSAAEQLASEPRRELQAPAEAPAVAGAPAAARGAIHGHMLDQDLQPVTGILRLSLSLDREEREVGSRAVSADGAFRFADLAPGEYVVHVEEQSLPDGYVGPFGQDVVMHSVESYPPGFFRRPVLIPPEGGEFGTDVRVFRAASMFGYVRGPDTEPVEGVQVRLYCLGGGMVSVVSDGLTDSDGYYELVGIRPQHYRTGIYFSQDHPMAGVSKEPPVDLDVRPGERIPLDFRLGGGGWTVKGRIVDQDGLPFAHLDVLCFYAQDPARLAPGQIPLNMGASAGSVWTNERGEYSFTGVFQHLIAIQVGMRSFSFGDYESGPGKCPIVRWPKQQRFDLTETTGTFEVADIVAVRSRPFVVDGRLVVDPEWAARHEGTRFEVLVRFPDAPDAPGQSVKLEDSIFRWWCEPTHAAAEIVVTSRDAGIEKSTWVEPVPSTTQALEIRIP